jgi:hypothetical protein
MAIGVGVEQIWEEQHMIDHVEPGVLMITEG